MSGWQGKTETLQMVEKKKGLYLIYEDWYLAFEMQFAWGLHQLQAETAAFHLTSFLEQELEPQTFDIFLCLNFLLPSKIPKYNF